MREDNVSILDFHLLPTLRALKPRLTFRKPRQAALRRYQLTTIETLAESVAWAAGPLT